MKKELFIALSMLVASTSIYASTSSSNSWSGFGETTSKIKKADNELIIKADNTPKKETETQQENKIQPVTKEAVNNHSYSSVASLDDNISSITSTLMSNFSLLIALVFPLFFLGFIRSVLSGGR